MPNRYQLAVHPDGEADQRDGRGGLRARDPLARPRPELEHADGDDQHDDERAAEQQPHERVGGSDAGEHQRGEQRFGAFAPGEQREPEHRKRHGDGERDQRVGVQVEHAMGAGEDRVPAGMLVFAVALLDDEDLRPGLSRERLADVTERVVARPISELEDLQRDQQSEQRRGDPDGERREPPPERESFEPA
jgi:hypothetical protein